MSELKQFQTAFYAGVSGAAVPAAPMKIYSNTALLGAIEALNDNYPVTREIVGKRAFDIFRECFERGVLIRTTGDIIALSPPLIISKEQIDELVGTLADALRQAA